MNLSIASMIQERSIGSPGSEWCGSDFGSLNQIFDIFSMATLPICTTYVTELKMTLIDHT